MKGVFDFDIEGEKAGFRFDMLAAAMLEDLEGKPVSGVLKEIHDAAADTSRLRMGLVMNVMYATACSYAESNGNDKPSKSQVSTWAQSIDATDLYMMLGTGISMFVPKNLKAPDSGAQAKTNKSTASTIGAESQ